MKEGHQKDDGHEDADPLEEVGRHQNRNDGGHRSPLLGRPLSGCVPDVDVGEEGEEEQDDAKAMKEIERFNQKNPTRRITPLNVLQSVRNRNKRIDQAQDGVYLPKSRRDAMEAGRFALGD